MATFTTTRITSAPKSGATLNDSSYDTVDIDNATSGYYVANGAVAIHIASGTPNGNITIRLYRSPNGSAKLETEPARTITIPFTATGDKRVSIGGMWHGYNRVRVDNATGANATWDFDREQLKQASA